MFGFGITLGSILLYMSASTHLLALFVICLFSAHCTTCISLFCYENLYSDIYIGRARICGYCLLICLLSDHCTLILLEYICCVVVWRLVSGFNVHKYPQESRLRSSSPQNVNGNCIVRVPGIHLLLDPLYLGV